ILRWIDSHNAAQWLSIDHCAESLGQQAFGLLSKFFPGKPVIMMPMFRLALLTTTALTVVHLASPVAHARNADAPLVVAQAAPPAETGPDGKPKQPPKGPPPAAAPPHAAPPAAPPHPPAPPVAAPPPHPAPPPPAA